MSDAEFHVVAIRKFTVVCDVAITAAGHRWRFPNAYAPYSTEVYGSIDEAFAAAQLFAEQRAVPIRPASEAGGPVDPSDLRA